MQSWNGPHAVINHDVGLHKGKDSRCPEIYIRLNMEVLRHLETDVIVINATAVSQHCVIGYNRMLMFQEVWLLSTSKGSLVYFQNF